MNVPLGIQNKNYLNLKKRPGWQNSEGVDDQGHVKFKNPSDGICAAIRNLAHYWFFFRLRTIDSIIANWAPVTDPNARNVPSEYAKYIWQRTSIASDAQLEFFDDGARVVDETQLKNIIEAMAEYENHPSVFRDLVPQAKFDEVFSEGLKKYNDYIHLK